MADNDILGSLKGLLGDNADEKINAVMNMLGSNQGGSHKDVVNVDDSIVVDKDNSFLTTNKNKEKSSGSSNFLTPEGLEYAAKIKGIIDEMGSANDPRSNLLMSLRPYMRDTRKKSIDNAVKILNLTRFSGLFNI